MYIFFSTHIYSHVVCVFLRSVSILIDELSGRGLVEVIQIQTSSNERNDKIYDQFIVRI
jgi:hypothetical protein